MNKNEDDLKKLFEDFNREQMSERFNADERAQIRFFFRKDGPADQLNMVLERQRRMAWLAKSIGMFLLAAPALTALWQLWSKLIDWIRGQ